MILLAAVDTSPTVDVVGRIPVLRQPDWVKKVNRPGWPIEHRNKPLLGCDLSPIYGQRRQ